VSVVWEGAYYRMSEQAQWARAVVISLVVLIVWAAGVGIGINPEGKFSWIGAVFGATPMIVLVVSLVGLIVSAF